MLFQLENMIFFPFEIIIGEENDVSKRLQVVLPYRQPQ
jgi:hypothetical protein